MARARWVGSGGSRRCPRGSGTVEGRPQRSVVWGGLDRGLALGGPFPRKTEEGLTKPRAPAPLRHPFPGSGIGSVHGVCQFLDNFQPLPILVLSGICQGCLWISKAPMDMSGGTLAASGDRFYVNEGQTQHSKLGQMKKNGLKKNRQTLWTLPIPDRGKGWRRGGGGA